MTWAAYYNLTMITKCPRMTNNATLMTTIVTIQTATKIKSINYMLFFTAFLFIFVLYFVKSGGKETNVLKLLPKKSNLNMKESLLYTRYYTSKLNNRILSTLAFMLYVTPWSLFFAPGIFIIIDLKQMS